MSAPNSPSPKRARTDDDAEASDGSKNDVFDIEWKLPVVVITTDVDGDESYYVKKTGVATDIDSKLLNSIYNSMIGSEGYDRGQKAVEAIIKLAQSAAADVSGWSEISQNRYAHLLLEKTPPTVLFHSRRD